MRTDVDRAGAASATDTAQSRRASNRRTALILLSIAAVFFVGIIATRWIGGGTTGIGVIGAAILMYLVVAIGRNLRRADSGNADAPTPSRPASEPR
jgi:uncharacterized membrane protein (DUF4010 family)